MSDDRPIFPQPKPLPEVPEPRQQKATRPEVDPALEAWKAAVKERAGRQCEMRDRLHKCFGWLDAHHIVGKGAYPRLKLDEDNGVALCRVAHDLVHRSRWFRRHFNAWMDSTFPGRRERLMAKAQREARLA